MDVIINACPNLNAGLAILYYWKESLMSSIHHDNNTTKPPGTSVLITNVDIYEYFPSSFHYEQFEIHFIDLILLKMAS